MISSTQSNKLHNGHTPPQAAWRFLISHQTLLVDRNAIEHAKPPEDVQTDFVQLKQDSGFLRGPVQCHPIHRTETAKGNFGHSHAWDERLRNWLSQSPSELRSVYKGHAPCRCSCISPSFSTFSAILSFSPIPEVYAKQTKCKHVLQ